MRGQLVDDDDPNSDDIASRKSINLFVRHATNGLFFTSYSVGEGLVKEIQDCIPD